MGPVKQTNGSSIPPVEILRYFTPPFDIAQLFRMATQDDGTREGGNGGKILTKDINGNPAETDSSQQMREAHQLDEKSTVISVGGRPGSSGANNHEMGHTQGEDFAGINNRNRRARRNKRNARQQGIEVHPDKDESYVGNVSNIDDLVKYINNDISAEKVKEIDGTLPPATQGKLPKKKERNKGKTSETSGARGSLDTHLTSSHSDCSTAKQAESKEAADSLDDKDRGEMGNSVTTEKLDSKEDGTRESSSEVINESETKTKKTPKSETPNYESSKPQKNYVVPSSKTPANTKQEKSTSDKTKAKDSNAEDIKVKNAKKMKSKPVKDSELCNRVTSRSPPATDYMQFDVLENAQGQHQENAQGQWCTVSKPQKKKRSQVQTSVVHNSYTPTHHTHSKDLQISPSPYPVDPHRRSQHHRTLQHPSSRPLFYSPSYLKATESAKREKDLSPSEFPVLNSSPRDYRRSLENVFDTGALISDKDSDKESSKSFPADIGLVGRCRTTYPVSYASMASGNTAHESVDSSKAESVTSSVEDSSVEFSTNSASLKWKGSPQERRHSIGSAPKGLSKNVLQRTGSQEMLLCDKDLRSPSVTIPNKLSNPNCKNMVSSDSTGSFTSSDADSARGSEAGSEGLGEDFPATPANASSRSHSGASVETKKTPVHSEGKLTNVNTESEKTKSTKSIPGMSAHIQTARNESKMSSGAKQVINGQNKGVVFCNGNEQFPPIRGLQFGFFPEEEDASVVTNSVLTEPSVPVGGEEISQSVPVDSSKLCSSSLSISSQQLSTAVANSSSTLSDHTVKPPKGPHIAGLNGFISPQLSDSNPGLVLQTSANSSVSTEQTLTQVESTGPGSLSSDSASNISQKASGSRSEPKEELLQDIFEYGPELPDKSRKIAVYLRPPEEIARSENSQAYLMAVSFLGANSE